MKSKYRKTIAVHVVGANTASANTVPCCPKLYEYGGAGTDWPVYRSIQEETRLAVDTACAAFHLNRRPQTLRAWASTEGGVIRPMRVHGRLAWPVSELRRVLGVTA